MTLLINVFTRLAAKKKKVRFISSIRCEGCTVCRTGWNVLL